MKKDMAQELNKYLADVGVLYIKWHNLHWNVVGKQFKSVHEYLESLYDAMADVLDETAEILKINNELPLASMKDYLAVTQIEELTSAAISVDDVIEVVIKDMKKMKATAQKIRAMANEEDAFDVTDMLEGHLNNYNKNIWFLDAMRK